MACSTIDEPALWARFKQQGDQQAREALIVWYMPQVRALVLSCPAARACDSFDDAIAEAYLALVRCADWFDPSRGVPFLKAAVRRIYGAVYDLARRAWGSPEGRHRTSIVHVPFSELGPSGGGAVDEAAEPRVFVLPDPVGPAVETTEDARAVGRALLGLPEVWRWATVWRACEGLGHVEVALKLGFSYTRAFQVWYAARNRLRRLLAHLL